MCSFLNRVNMGREGELFFLGLIDNDFQYHFMPGYNFLFKHF